MEIGIRYGNENAIEEHASGDARFLWKDDCIIRLIEKNVSVT